jgi:hypothetical protein
MYTAEMRLQGLLLNHTVPSSQTAAFEGLKL